VLAAIAVDSFVVAEAPSHGVEPVMLNFVGGRS